MFFLWFNNVWCTCCELNLLATDLLQDFKLSAVFRIVEYTQYGFEKVFILISSNLWFEYSPSSLLSCLSFTSWFLRWGYRCEEVSCQQVSFCLMCRLENVGLVVLPYVCVDSALLWLCKQAVLITRILTWETWDRHLNAAHSSLFHEQPVSAGISCEHMRRVHYTKHSDSLFE